MTIRCITRRRPQSAWERFCGALCRFFKALTGGKGTNSMG
jgi:hypothetical protein